MRFFFIYLIVVVSLYTPTETLAFDNLADIARYAQSLPEFPPNESFNPYHPEFNSFNRDHKVTYFESLLAMFGFKKSFNLNIGHLSQKLHNITDVRELEGCLDDFVQKFYITGRTNWFIWGPLYGAFHSLVRTLQYLESKKIIDNTLKIVDPESYFIFSGNIISYSPYAVETLYLLLTLLEKNPDRVVLLREKSAVPSKLYNLKNELEVRFNLPVEKIEKELERFSNTLPLIFYLIGSEGEIVRISNSSLDPSLFNETQWAYFFEDRANGSFKIKDIELSAKKIDIKTWIKLYAASEVPHNIDQLRYAKQDGIQIWSLFSSATELFKTMFNFHYDSLVVLTTGKYFLSWRLGLVSQDLDGKRGFVNNRLFNVETGQEIFSLDPEERIEYFEQQILLAKIAEQKSHEICQLGNNKSEQAGQESPKEAAVQGNILAIGNSTDFSKVLKEWSDYLKSGLLLPIDRVNNQGGIDGTKIQLIFLDDEHQPKLARANVETFLKDFKADILLGANGTATLDAYIDLVKEKKVLSIFPNTGSFRDPTISYLLHFGPSYKDEGYAVTKYVLEATNFDRFAFFYQKDGYGADLLEGAKKALANSGNRTIMEVSYDPFSVDVVEQAKKIKEFKPDVIAFFSLSLITQKLVSELGTDFVRGRLFMGNSRLGDQSFMKFLTRQGVKIIMPQVVPDPQTSQIKLVQDFREFARFQKVPFEQAALMGYIEASLFLDMMAKMGKPFSKDRFVEAFEAIHDYDFKGMKFNFDPNTRQLSQVIWLDTGSGDWIEHKIEAEKKQLDNKQNEANDKNVMQEEHT